jgi:hypothetical protein
MQKILKTSSWEKVYQHQYSGFLTTYCHDIIKIFLKVVLNTTVIMYLLFSHWLTFMSRCRTQDKHMCFETHPIDIECIHIATTVVSSNPARGEMYSIQHYGINFVHDLRQVGGFLRVLKFPPLIKLNAKI